MNEKITDILSRMKLRSHVHYNSLPLSDMAELLSIISEQQLQAADKLERHTKKLVYLTWTLLFLTIALLVHEIIINQNSYAEKYRAKITTNFKPVQP